MPNISRLWDQVHLESSLSSATWKAWPSFFSEQLFPPISWIMMAASQHDCEEPERQCSKGGCDTGPGSAAFVPSGCYCCLAQTLAWTMQR